MFSLTKKLFDTIISVPSLVWTSKPDPISSKKKLLMETLAKLEDTTDETNIKNEQKCELNKTDETTLKTKCFKKTGIITKLDTNYGFIDHKLYFQSEAFDHFANNLEVGTKVSYLAYKYGLDDTIKVIKILDIIQENWGEVTDDKFEQLLDDLQKDKPEYFHTQKMNLLGKITNKSGNKIYIDTVRGNQSIVVELDKVTIGFVPIEGDMISMNCKVQVDEYEFDWAGEILEVFTIEPQRSNIINGEITFINEYYGLIDNKYLFFPDSCNNFTPKLNDKCVSDAIESDQGQYNWRCLKVVLSQTSKNIVVGKSARNEEDERLIRNKNGITVTENISFTMKNLDERMKKTIIVENTNSDRSIKFVKYLFCIKKNQSQLYVTRPLRNIQIIIEPKSTLEIVVEARARFYGCSRELMILQFEHFKIGRFIEIEVQDELLLQPNSNEVSKKPTKEYTKQIWGKKLDYIPGERTAKGPAFQKVRIGDYEIPQSLKNAFLDNTTTLDIDNAISKYFPRLECNLSKQTYVDIFDGLIHLEEIELFHSFRKYDMDHGIFRNEGEFLALPIENVAESRPSIVIGDFITITKTWCSDEQFKSYQGFIHKVLQNRILLKFNPVFHQNYNGEGYKIVFHFSRGTFRRQHHAIRQALKLLGPEFLFPNRVYTKNPQIDVRMDDEGNLLHKKNDETTSVINWVNKNLNVIQKLAIVNVLKGEARPMPYVIFGPPGTGKTVTLIETIIQLYTLLPYSRILIGTPSNSAANLILERIINCNKLQKGSFVRIIGYNALERESIPENLLPYCITCDIAIEDTKEDKRVVTTSGVTLNCRKTQIGQHRITIGTCQALGSLIYLGFPRDHFTHVIIDEAGQCVEPELMIPAMFLNPDDGQIILAGDPMQLGPVILSSHALNRGYGISFLSRILERYPYQRDKDRFKSGYDERLVTKLLYNYRSVPSILKLYSDMFYNAELKSEISRENSKEIELYRKVRPCLPTNDAKDDCSVFMVGIRGQNMQYSDSPSWFNTSEARSVFKAVLDLMKYDVTPDDIGIISPYNQQVKIIRKLFEDADLKAPKVGSVEEFQGQERNIILLSTVRSTVNLVKKDNEHHIGFVRNEKRLNVAISRARSILVIFGNPHLLGVDENWKRIIMYCVENKTYSGCDLPSIF